MPFKKFLCFSEVFRSTLSEVWILIWLRWWWNKILDSVRKNTLISSNWPYVPHLLLERLNRLKKTWTLIDSIIRTFLTLNSLTVAQYFLRYRTIRFPNSTTRYTLTPLKTGVHQKIQEKVFGIESGNLWANHKGKSAILYLFEMRTSVDELESQIQHQKSLIILKCNS